jgi:hypothetical protein
MTEASKKYVKYQGVPTGKPVFATMHDAEIKELAPTMNVKGGNRGGQVQAATTKLWDEAVKAGRDVYYKRLEEDMRAYVLHLCFRCYFVLMIIRDPANFVEMVNLTLTNIARSGNIDGELAIYVMVAYQKDNEVKVSQ